jgi:glycosyltransferase involved in cell wall biosynthesis
MKTRVLYHSEASFVTSGYGVYAKELLRRLAKNPNYELAEFGGFGEIGDLRAKQNPWRFYGCKPKDRSAEMEEFDSHPHNKYGRWRFNHVLCDFKPHVVLSIRDHWMDAHIAETPLKKFFKWAYMTTVDSAPQSMQWLNTFMTADAMLSYSEWGADVLRKQCRNKINLLGTASPAADTNIFKPILDKGKHKKKFGFTEDCTIIGTVMRNQTRKLYPDIILSFRQLLNKLEASGQHNDAQNTFLYFHTAYPDMGWELPRLALTSGLASKILFTYACEKCGNVFPSFFQDATTICRHCGQFSAKMPTTQRGIDTRILNEVINVFDVYLQYAIAEGFGMPVVEAASCGIPVMIVDYSAMEDFKTTLKGVPLKVQRMFLDVGTQAYRAYPDNEYLADALYKFINLPPHVRSKKGRDTYNSMIKNYDWDKVAKVWSNYIDSVDVDRQDALWSSPAEILRPRQDLPQNVMNSEFIDWCITNIWGDPSKLHGYIAMRLLRDLNYGIHAVGGENPNDDTIVGVRPHAPFTKQHVINYCTNMRGETNLWEEIRTGRRELPENDTIKLAKR